MNRVVTDGIVYDGCNNYIDRLINTLESVIQNDILDEIK